MRGARGETVLAEAERVEVVVAGRLDELVLVDDVVEADGARAGGHVVLREELLGEVDELVDERLAAFLGALRPQG